MARVTRSASKAGLEKKVEKTSKVTKSTPSASAKTNNKLKSSPKKSEKLAQDLEHKEDEKKEDKEEEFQLPSDSEDEDEGGSDESDESDTELAIHDDIIGNADKEASASSSIANKSGHTIIKPITSKDKDTKDRDSSDNKNKRGVIYIGRLPVGFEEKELKKYFQQFGEITRLRLSRNKKTGKSKHYAFIEFKEFDVAKIAAETMNNYLLMGHLLQVSLLSNDKIHENLFVGANTKFKVIPFSKINQGKHDRKRSREEWEKLNNNHLNNLKSKQDSLNSMGINYDINDL